MSQPNSHCQRGHPYNDVNTYYWRGARHCRRCRRVRQRIPRVCGHCGKLSPIDMVVNGSDRCIVCARYRRKHGMDRPKILFLREKAKALGQRACSGCERILPLSAFYPNKPYGMQSQCRDCQRLHHRRWKAANRSKVREQGRQYGRSSKGREKKHRRRARELGAYVSAVDPIAIFDRDGWRCGICRKKVNPKYKPPHPLAATLDHIIPLAAGGTHQPENTQCAHNGCNSGKGARGGGEQLRLIG